MRGTQAWCRARAPESGIIPAYAGNTRLPGSCSRDVRDHPRVCGEHVRFQGAVEDRWGSSPRMRGTLLGDLFLLVLLGIIPAYAGNTAALGR